MEKFEKEVNSESMDEVLGVDLRELNAIFAKAINQ